MDTFMDESAGIQQVNMDVNSTSSSNQSLQQPPVFSNRSLIKVSVLAIIATISLLGNVAMLSSITRRRNRRSSTLYRLLLQLAIADLLVTFWCICGEAAWTYSVQWIAGDEFCKIFKYLQVFSLYLSTFIMVVIAFDRLKAVRQPVKRISSSRRYCVKYILLSWILSAIFASPQLAIFRVVRGPFQEEFHQCVTYGFYSEPWQEQLYSVFCILTMFIGPLIAFFIIYTFIFFTITKNERLFGSQRDFSNNRINLLRRAKLRTLRISLVIVVCFLICWTPYYVMMIFFIFAEPSNEVSDDLMSAIFFFGMSNSLVNPMIYGAFHIWQPTRYLPSSITTSKDHSRRGSQRPALTAAAAAAAAAPLAAALDPAESKEDHCFL